MGWNIHHIERTGSTNDTARELARSGSPHGTIVLADIQTAGRGTQGRKWFSAPGLGLYASFILRPDPGSDIDTRDLAGLPFAVGLALAETVASETGALCRLKWPNDLFWNRRKVAGILVENVFSGSRFEFAVAGIGLNLGHAEGDFPEDIRGLSASLSMITGRPFEREPLLPPLGEALERWYNILNNQGKAEVIEVFESWLAFSRGCSLRVKLRERTVPGSFLGLDGDGRLVVGTEAGPESFSCGSVLGLDWDR